MSLQANHLLSAAPIQAIGRQGAGGRIMAASTSATVQTLSGLWDVSGRSAGGSIALRAGTELFSSGSYLGQGTRGAAQGGQIDLLAPTITLSAASLDASGAGGGGQLHVGGGFQGAGLGLGANARTVTVTAGTSLRADATALGKGGQVVVWSEDRTHFSGVARARGGALGGDGGVLEVSGKADLVFGGTADASAPAGRPGTLLLDPRNIYIENTTVGGYGYDVRNIVYPGSDAAGPTGLVEQLGTVANGPILVNVPTGGLPGQEGVTYLFDGSTYGLLSALYGTATLGSQKANYSASGDSAGLLALISPGRNNGATPDAGAATWIDTTTGKLADGTSSGLIGSGNSLLGRTTGDFSQASVRFLDSGQALVFTPRWDNGRSVDAGGLTWLSGSTGRLADGSTGGAIGSGNSLLNTASAAYLPPADCPGCSSYVNQTVREYGGGNLLIYSGAWANGAVPDAGALTWLNGTTGALANGATGGAISAANSLVGSSAGDLNPSGGLLPNFYDPSSFFSRGGSNLVYDNTDAGAPVALFRFSTWDNTTTGATNTGALTWVDMASGKLGTGAAAIGAIGAANSLVGSSTNDQVGSSYQQLGGFNSYLPPNSQDYFVFLNPTWDNGTAADAGALTWIRGSTGRLATGAAIIGTLGAANSLVGSSAGDQVGGSYERIVQPNWFGSYFTNLWLTTTGWNNGSIADAGAFTWIEGSTGKLSDGSPAVGAIGVSNALVGSRTGDFAAGAVDFPSSVLFLDSSDYFNLTNKFQNLLVFTPNWDNGASAVNAGALTWVNGGTGKLATGADAFGALGSSTSLVGSHRGDAIGQRSLITINSYDRSQDLYPNVLARNPQWSGNTGAATFINGSTGALTDGTPAVGVVAAANSLVGSIPGDRVGSAALNLRSSLGGPLPDNVLLTSPDWRRGAGAITWINGDSGKLADGSNPFGVVSGAQSLAGSRPGDGIGSVDSITITDRQNVLLRNPLWDNGLATDAGAVTWINGSTGLLSDGTVALGAIGPTTSLVGSHSGDAIGELATAVGSFYDPGGTNLVLRSPSWDASASATDAGAVTWFNLATGKLADGNDAFGVVGATNSLVGSSTGDRVGDGFLTSGSLYGAGGVNLLLLSPLWNNTATTATDAGAVTWIGGASGKLAGATSFPLGAISSVNSLVGSTRGDGVGSLYDRYDGSPETLLLRSTAWDSPTAVDAGAITWLNLATGQLADGSSSFGAVAASNSLVGSTAGDRVGLTIETSGGRYAFLGSPNWDNGHRGDAGAITWIDRQLGQTVGGEDAFGAIRATNSLVGSSSGDQLGIFSISEPCTAGAACTNQDYVVPFNFGTAVLIGSPRWDRGPLVDAGAISAVRLSDGRLVGTTTFASGALSAANALVGSSAGEQLGLFRREDQLADGTPVVETNVGTLSNGAALVASPRWDSDSTADVGAVALIPTTTPRVGKLNDANALVGSTSGDFSSFTAQSLGSNGLLVTPHWSSGAVAGAGAITWIDGTTGRLANGKLGGVIGSSTSLLGSRRGDFSGVAVALSGNGAFVHLPGWNNGTDADAGALGWIQSSTGALADGSSGGVVGPGNALLGSQSGDLASYELRSLSGGNLLVFTPSWDNGAVVDAGALTWLNGITPALASNPTGVSGLGVIGPSHSIVGGSTGDLNGSYLNQLSGNADSNVLVVTPFWNGATAGGGAITWLSSATGKLSDGSSGGVIGPTNSLLATGQGTLGGFDLADTTNPYRESPSGNVVIYSSAWGFSSALGRGIGSLTWLNGKTGALANGATGGVISAANSLVGSAIGDLAPQDSCFFCSTATSYFAYNTNSVGNGLLFRNVAWNNRAGAVTWLDTSTGRLANGNPAVGTIGATNSLVGSTANDGIGSYYDTVIKGGNVLLLSSGWAHGTAPSAGAVTWLSVGTGQLANGSAAIGPISAANSLVGSSSFDSVGSNYDASSFGNAVALFSGYWDNGAAIDAGAFTWLNAATGTLANGSVAIGALSAANSLVGSSSGDSVALSRRTFSGSFGSNIGLISPDWNNGAAADAGAVTWINSSSGLLANGAAAIGVLSAANSLVGTSAGDRIGSTALEVGSRFSPIGTNLMVLSGTWDNGPLVDAGAVTWISGLTGQLLDGSAAIGAVSRNVSIVGTSSGDQLGALHAPMGSVSSSEGLNVLLQSPNWDALTPGGPIVNAGAVTWVNGANGLMVDESGKGGLSGKNSLIGNSSGDQIGRSVDVVAPDTFFVNGPGASLVGTPPATANVVAQKVRIVPEPLYPLAAPGINFADARDASVTISPSQITAITNTGTALVLQASNDILLRPLSDIAITNPRGNGGDLTLQAGRNIALNSSISSTNGNLTLIANDPGASPGVREPGDGGIVQRTGTSLNAGTGTVTFAVRPSTATAMAGNIALSQVTAGAIAISGANLSLSGAILTANGSPTAAGSLSVTSTGALSVANSTFQASSPTGDGGSISLDAKALQIGGSTFQAFGTGSGNGGTIALGALSTPEVPTSLSLTGSLLDARGGAAVSPQPLSNGGTITLDGGAIAMAGSTLNTSGGATGGSIAIGMASTNNPTSVSIVNSSLIADPATTGGIIAVGGSTIVTSGSLYNVFGASGGFLDLGSPLTAALIFGAGTSVLGGGSGSFTYQGTTIYDPQFAPFSGGTLRIIGTIFSPGGPTSPTDGATGPLPSPLGSTSPLSALTSALIASSLLNTNFNLLLVTGVNGTTNQPAGPSMPAAATGLFSSSDPSLFADLPLQLTLDQSSLLHVDGYLDPVLDPSLLGLDALDLQRRAASSPAAQPGSEATGSLSVDEKLRLPNLGQGQNPAARGDQERVSVTDLEASQAETLFLKGEQEAQRNATVKLGVEPEPDKEAMNVLQLQEWLRQVVPYVQQRLQSGR
ncbi:S-layer family protein [Cyanobium sp. Morenito 9A2]|uniref:beta strand repeat-containing protein n=1 Tax=Cyanobium sp. Morenito 9A2 TaxID=2823718 RepID=UPI0020CFE81E|nr:hypothetical protein [Cyanobium sp. Morenito 9A2]